MTDPFLPIAEPSPPTARRLRVFAFDPALGLRLETAELNHVTLDVPWEDTLQPGPVGEYLEVINCDTTTGQVYPPVDLNHPYLLANAGHATSEANPQFHQQMVYAVAMTTISHFERALGRRALWSPRRYYLTGTGEDEFVRRLRVYPHALREANAYYSPKQKALLFGYFPASAEKADGVLPGGMVYTSLSHDIIVHETTHALLDGMHHRFLESSNPDVYAFHEAFADLVALFQHFTLSDVLHHQIAKSRGDLGKQNLLGELAQQFGEAVGRRGALRSALGGINEETGQWEAHKPTTSDYQRYREPHARGSILVAAVFEAFLSIYKIRIADLLRIASGGTGVLPEGDLPPDLVARLAKEASKTAKQILNMCIRALDYCPSFDITFGEYLRALVTADHDLVPDDDLGYRLAVIEAFRRRGIYPQGVRSLSPESLRWLSPQQLLGRGLDPTVFTDAVKQTRRAVARWNLRADRQKLFEGGRVLRRKFHRWIHHLLALTNLKDVEQVTGLALGRSAPKTIERDSHGIPKFEVHSAWPARRVGPDGQLSSDIVVSVTQRRAGYFKESDQAQADVGKPARGPDFVFRGGCTIVLDLDDAMPRYFIRKSICSEERLVRRRAYEQDETTLALKELAVDDGKHEPFAFLHRLDDMG